MTGTFNHVKIYDQKCVTDEGVNVASSIFAVYWTIDENTTKISSRVRVTCVYDDTTPGVIIPHGGTIEQWKTNGWVLVDEYFDTRSNFESVEAFTDHVFRHAKSFITGTVLVQCDQLVMPDRDPDEGPSKNNKKPSLSVIDFKSKAKNRK